MIMLYFFLLKIWIDTNFSLRIWNTLCFLNQNFKLDKNFLIYNKFLDNIYLNGLHNVNNYKAHKSKIS